MKLNLLNADRKKGKSIDKASAPRSRRGRNVLVFFAFVVLSAVFWFMQSLQDVYTTSFSIPISYSELPPDIGVSGRLPDRLDIMLKDQGIVYNIGKADDLEGGTHVIHTKPGDVIDFAKDITSIERLANKLEHKDGGLPANSIKYFMRGDDLYVYISRNDANKVL